MKKCKYCQSEINSKAKICPYCRKRQSYLKIIIAIVVIIIALIVIFIQEQSSDKIYSSINNSTFKSKVSSFNYYYLINCSELEEIANDIKSYWYDSIVEDKYNGDMDEAVKQALQDNEDKVQNQKSNHDSMQSSYIEIIKLNCHSNYCDEIKEYIKNSYDIYDEFYNFALYPSGSLTNYVDEFSRLDSKSIYYYNKISDLLKLFE